ncbi:MAG: hypothetical protein JWQ96_1130 [Segetibacter sp.]|nr:hypothetical protein [Segetibacter sp.]
MKNAKIIIAGGTGYIGRYLATLFAAENQVIILTRNVNEADNNAFEKFHNASHASIKLVQWNAKDEGDWEKEIDGSDLVINLAGKSVNCRYTARNKQEIFDSRTNATTAIGKAIAKAVVPPKLWINAASTTIYRHATDKPQDEISGEMHNDFSVQVCKLWEKTFFESRTPFTSKVALRLAITLGTGGVMIPYFNLLKFGLGGRQGSGKQMYSWVHIHDVYRSINFMYENSELDGVFNVCSPNPVTNTAFMQTLRKITGHKIGLPAFEWMLKLGAPIIGTETELVLKSRWVVPRKLAEAGFTFKYPRLEEAFANIIAAVPRRKYHLF